MSEFGDTDVLPSLSRTDALPKIASVSGSTQSRRDVIKTGLALAGSAALVTTGLNKLAGLGENAEKSSSSITQSKTSQSPQLESLHNQQGNNVELSPEQNALKTLNTILGQELF